MKGVYLNVFTNNFSTYGGVINHNNGPCDQRDRIDWNCGVWRCHGVYRLYSITNLSHHQKENKKMRFGPSGPFLFREKNKEYYERNT